MKLVKDVGVVINYDNVLTEVRIESNNYVLDVDEQQVESVEIVYQLYSYGQCDIISVYNYINEFIETDYNTFSDFEKQFCQSLGLFGSEVMSDATKKEYFKNISAEFQIARNKRFDNVMIVLMFNQIEADVITGYTAFEEVSERYIKINSSELLGYFYSVSFESNTLYSVDNKLEVIAILEI